MFVEYRTLAIDDLDGIEPLWQKLNNLHIRLSPHFSEDYAAEDFSKRRAELIQKTASAQIRVHLATIAEQPVGYCVSTASANGVGEVDSLFVDEKYRGHGIGDVFLETALEWMDQFCVQMKKIIVYAGNEGVIPFYQKFRFYQKFQILEQKGTYENSTLGR